MMKKTLLFTVIAMLLTNLFALPAAASPWNVRHDYRLQLNQREVYRVAWDYSLHAHADGNGNNAPAPDMKDAPPPNPPAPGQAPLAAGPITITANASPAAFADANAQFAANAAANGIATGFHRVWGDYRAPNWLDYGESRGRSTLMLNTGTTDGRGNIRWKPTWSVDTIQGGGSFWRDPIDFTVIDLDTGSIMETIFLNISGDLGAGGSASWEEGIFSLNGMNGSFVVDVTSPYSPLEQRGMMTMSFANGVVTASEDSGVFDNFLPLVGGAANFSRQIGDDEGYINLDFDFGPVNTRGYNFAITFDGAGGGEITGVPEPASMLLLLFGLMGVLGIRRKLKK